MDGKLTNVCAKPFDSFATPGQLRFLFTQVIIHIPCDTLALYREYTQELCNDHLNRGTPVNLTLNCVLNEIARHLAASNCTLKQFHLPEPEYVEHGDEYDGVLFSQEDLNRFRLETPTFYESLNSDQRSAFDAMSEIIRTYSAEPETFTPPLIFIDGAAGRGKSYLLKGFINYLRGSGLSVFVCGTTALCVQDHLAGRTAHSLFGIPVIKDDAAEVVSMLRLNSRRARLLYSADVIVWEELPMANRTSLECAEQFLSLVMGFRGAERQFGGKIIIGCGDFRQVAPVVKGGGPTAVFDASVRASELWKTVQVIRLVEPMRNAEDAEFSRFVDDIGEGLGLDDITQQVTVPKNLIPCTSNVDDVVDRLYPTNRLQDFDYLCRRSFLSPLNSTVDDFNSTILNRLEATEREYEYCNH
jgi:hypothetical protein